MFLLQHMAPYTVEGLQLVILNSGHGQSIIATLTKTHTSDTVLLLELMRSAAIKKNKVPVSYSSSSSSSSPADTATLTSRSWGMKFVSIQQGRGFPLLRYCAYLVPGIYRTCRLRTRLAEANQYIPSQVIARMEAGEIAAVPIFRGGGRTAY